MVSDSPAEYPSAVSMTLINQDFLRELGAEPTTYGDGVVDRIRGLAPDGVDAVFDVTGHGFIDAAIELRGGTDRIVTTADLKARERGVPFSMADPHTLPSDDFAPVLDLVAAGEVTTHIAHTFAFADVAAAATLSDAGHLRGKIVITVP